MVTPRPLQLLDCCCCPDYCCCCVKLSLLLDLIDGNCYCQNYSNVDPIKKFSIKTKYLIFRNKSLVFTTGIKIIISVGLIKKLIDNNNRMRYLFFKKNFKISAFLKLGWVKIFLKIESLERKKDDRDKFFLILFIRTVITVNKITKVREPLQQKKIQNSHDIFCNNKNFLNLVKNCKFCGKIKKFL